MHQFAHHADRRSSCAAQAKKRLRRGEVCLRAEAVFCMTIEGWMGNVSTPAAL
jgi:hypothetical protein